MGPLIFGNPHVVLYKAVAHGPASGCRPGSPAERGEITAGASES